MAAYQTLVPRPMLAATVTLEEVHFPVFASAKLDGIRAMVVGGRLLSRTLKPIANHYTYNRFSKMTLNGLDGELIFGSPTDSLVFNHTTRVVSRHDGCPNVTFYVFDNFLHEGTFKQRLLSLEPQDGIEMLPQRLVHNLEELEATEEWALERGYEGLILRSPNGAYKHGRSTLREAYMMKLKRFVDSEAVVLSTEEEMENLNPQVTSELGLAKRSSHQENKLGKGRMGALVVRDLKSGVEFKIGTGFTVAEREEVWKPGDVVTYKCFPVGTLEKPRHPVFKGRRAVFDVPAPGE